MKNYRIRFVMVFEGDLEAETDEDAHSYLSELSTGEVWNNGENWFLEETEREIIDSWEVEEE